jgi:hypothetical protein
VIQVFEAVGNFSLFVVTVFVAFSLFDYWNGGWK